MATPSLPDGCYTSDLSTIQKYEELRRLGAVDSFVRRPGEAADAPVGVLVVGESGVGKESAARWVHDNSPRAMAPFVTVNCAAIPQNLAESELFGHVKGSFTGAHVDRIGHFQAAHTGTIFLDEIGELPLDLQAKLLRVLQAREIQRVGDTKTIPIDVRVIAATNRDLLREVNEGQFRLDLYQRVATHRVELPPLRKRGDDVIVLAGKVVGRRRGAYPESAVDITDPLSRDAIDALRRHTWPGNVRELQGAIEGALLRTPAGQRQITAAELHVAIDPTSSDADAPSSDEARASVTWADYWLASRHDLDAVLQHSSITWDEYRQAMQRALFEAVLRRHGGRETWGAVKDACAALGVSESRFAEVVPTAKRRVG